MLERARGLIEGKFLALGQTLEQAVEVVGGLISGLDRLAAALDEAVVDRTTSALTGAGARLNGLATAHHARRDRFQALSATNAALARRTQQMHRTLSYLRAFAINIKIAAGAVEGAQSEFGAFSEEIRAAIEAAAGQLNDFEGELAALAAEVGAALEHQRALAQRCAAMLPALPNRLEADALAIAAHHKRIAALAAELGALARSLQAKVASALGALQIGDITRQRVEHVETALGLLERLAPQDRARAGPGVRALLAAQLQDCADALGRDVERLAQSLAGVAQDAGRLLRVRAAAGEGEGTGEDDGVLRRLQRSVDEAVALVGEVEAAESAAEAVGQSAETAAEGLTQRIGAIRSIRTAIHFMALNANLKCSRLGEAGKPLSVIAVELRVQAGELDVAAGETETVLAEFGQSRAARPEAAAPSGAGSADIAALLKGAAEPIQAAAEQAGADLGALTGDGSRAIAALRGATERLGFRQEVSEVLHAAAEALASEAGEPPAGDGAYAALGDEIFALYTMARERELHARFAPARAEAAAAA